MRNIFITLCLFAALSVGAVAWDTNSLQSPVVDDAGVSAWPTNGIYNGLIISNYAGNGIVVRIGINGAVQTTNQNNHSSFTISTNAHWLSLDQYGTVCKTGTNGLFSIALTNGTTTTFSNGNLTLSSNGVAFGTVSAAAITAPVTLTNFITLVVFAGLSNNFNAYTNFSGTNTALIAAFLNSYINTNFPNRDVVLSNLTVLKVLQAPSQIISTNNQIGSDYSFAIGGKGHHGYFGDTDSGLIGGTSNAMNDNVTSSVFVGGKGNRAYSSFAIALIGGMGNDIETGDRSVITGGLTNTIYGQNSTISGGGFNIIDNFAHYSSILNGTNNYISAPYSRILSGNNGRVVHAGTTILSDSQTNQLSSTTTNQLLMRFQRGVAINATTAGTNDLEVAGNIDSQVGHSVNGTNVLTLADIAAQARINSVSNYLSTNYEARLTAVSNTIVTLVLARLTATNNVLLATIIASNGLQVAANLATSNAIPLVYSGDLTISSGGSTFAQSFTSFADANYSVLLTPLDTGSAQIPYDAEVIDAASFTARLAYSTNYDFHFHWTAIHHNP